MKRVDIGSKFNIGPFILSYYQDESGIRYVDIEYLFFKKTIRTSSLPGGSFVRFAAELRDWIDQTLINENELDKGE